MGDKEPISARGTHILDEDELDQLDELALTSAIDLDVLFPDKAR